MRGKESRRLTVASRAGEGMRCGCKSSGGGARRGAGGAQDPRHQQQWQPRAGHHTWACNDKAFHDLPVHMPQHRLQEEGINAHEAQNTAREKKGIEKC